MRERVVIKWGGGLITNKDRMKSVRHDIIDNLANQLESCVAAGLDVVLVHGAGSFGHLKAKAYRLADGRCSPDAMPAEMTQDDAVVAVSVVEVVWVNLVSVLSADLLWSQAIGTGII